MAGKVIVQPELRHDCAPGWTHGPVSDGIRDADPPFGMPVVPAGSRAAYPPSGYDYPKGTVWQCDECGRTWVSTGPPAPQSPGFCDFRPEHRWERRRRERRAGP